MSITKHRLIMIVSDYTGDIELAAKRLGVSPKTIANWATDAKGNVVSRQVANAALGGLMREHIKALREGRIAPDAPSSVAWKDLVDLSRV
jgi:hypothetical protein